MQISQFTIYTLQLLIVSVSFIVLLQLGDAFYDIDHFRLMSCTQPVIPVWVQEAGLPDRYQVRLACSRKRLNPVTGP